VRQFKQDAAEAPVQRDGVNLRQTAGVGQDEAGGAGRVKARRDLVRFEDRDYGDVMNGLRAGGVIVEYGDSSVGRRVGPAYPLPGIWFDPRWWQLRADVSHRHSLLLGRSGGLQPPLMSC
jgi:hypothetical protein